MSVDQNKLEELLRQLPDELQKEVMHFAESLLRQNADRSARGNGTPPVSDFFGAWDSGDPRSSDNDRIDADVAREYSSSHEADS